VDTTWPFDQPPNGAVFTVRGVLECGEPVLHVTHDADDQGWQFLGSETPTEADVRIVALDEVLSLDPSIRTLADLPVGWHAWRQTAGGRWVREVNPDVDD